jgi:hypothetical protein
MKLSQGVAMLFALAVASAAAAQPTFEQVVKKAEATFEPATARPGQTVMLKVSLKLLEGWHTYPTFQPEKAAKTYVNKLTFPQPGAIVYVGTVDDPPDAKEKAEPLANIEKMLVYPGSATWERKAVVLPSAKAGKATSKVMFKVLVCDKDNCLPPKTLELEATLKIAGDPVAVDPKYKAEVEKAQRK